MTVASLTEEYKMKKHTVEKIGGTSMSAFDAVRKNIILRPTNGETPNENNINTIYQRVFVVSAYGGITDLLLEHKKSGKPGLYQLYSSGAQSEDWREKLEIVRKAMFEKNQELFSDPAQLEEANDFIGERLSQAESCMADLRRVCRHGHFAMDQMLDSLREMLACIGEAHSAWNMARLLQNDGINAKFVDLTGWYGDADLGLDELIKKEFGEIDTATTLPIVTGYARSKVGLMANYDRGYSEMTFSRIAVLTDACEAVIHKEFHLSSADPRVVGVDKSVPIGRTNYDVADHLALLGMEAIHPNAAKGLRKKGIALRLRNTFEPEHKGTLIDNDYISEKPRVEIVAGKSGVRALEFFNQDMSGELVQYNEALLEILKQHNIDLVTKDYSANAITLFLDCGDSELRGLVRTLESRYPEAEISTQDVAMVSMIGSDMKEAGLLSKAVSALAEEDISVLAVQQSMRQVCIQMVVADDKYDAAVRALHSALVEIYDHGRAICLAS
jgi:aspartate kinase